MPAVVFRDFLDLLELAQAAGAARVEPTGSLVEHMDDIDAAQLVGRGLVGKGLLKTQTAAFLGQAVAVDIAIVHLEIDRLVVDHIG